MDFMQTASIVLCSDYDNQTKEIKHYMKIIVADTGSHYFVRISAEQYRMFATREQMVGSVVEKPYPVLNHKQTDF